MNTLAHKKILLAVTGSIAAYKAAELARLLIKEHANVKVVMTKSALEFITPLTFQAITNQPVYIELLTPTESAMEHISLAKWADYILIAPASAATIAKLAHGFADDLLSTLCLATTAPIYFAPAMNQQMWRNALTQTNVHLLLTHGYQIIGPATGNQACGDNGFGRLEEPEKIISYLTKIQTTALNGIHVIITAGPTQEPLDPVRYISNYSSGKMGYALAQAFTNHGATVTLISGPTHLTPPCVQQFISVKTAEDMHHAVMQALPNCQILIAAAAVADYKVETVATQKVKKQAAAWQVNLVKNPDILLAIAALQTKPFLVGFAAETEHILDNAQKKLSAKKLDMLIANQIDVNTGAPFYSDTNTVSVLQAQQAIIHLPTMSKDLLAQQLVELISNAYKKSKSESC